LSEEKKMKSKLIMALAVMGLFCATQTRADDTADDLRCLMVSMALADSNSSAQQVSGTISSMYWLGRIDARTPGLDVEKRLADIAATMKPESAKAELARCDAILQSRGKLVSNMTDEMDQAEQQLQNSR
jgi:hypothetical protein